MGALKRLTKQQHPSVYLKMLTRAHEFSETIVGPDMETMESHLRQSNAFEEHTQARLKIIPLME